MFIAPRNNKAIINYAEGIGRVPLSDFGDLSALPQDVKLAIEKATAVVNESKNKAEAERIAKEEKERTAKEVEEQRLAKLEQEGKSTSVESRSNDCDKSDSDKLDAYIVSKERKYGKGTKAGYAQMEKDAEGGNVEALNLLGSTLAFVAIDKSENTKDLRQKAINRAVEYLESAAEQGHSLSQNDLARIYLLRPVDWGIPYDEAEGIKWLQKAAAQGSHKAQDLLREIKSNSKSVVDSSNSVRPKDNGSASKVAESSSNIMVSAQGGTLPANSLHDAEAVTSFSIGRYKTTWAEWKMVRTWAMANGYDIGRGDGSADTHPVHNVSWFDVVKWCNAKSEKEGLTPVYTVKGAVSVNGAVYRTGEYNNDGSSTVRRSERANGYRLPTNPEWEWAARGGTLTHGYKYSGSNTLNDVGWYDENSDGAFKNMDYGQRTRGTWPVGQKAANELGLYDMSGNVYECTDSTTYAGKEQYIRGGSWRSAACAVTTLNSDAPRARINSLGFRLVRNSEK